MRETQYRLDKVCDISKAFALMVSDQARRTKKGDQLCASENTGDQPLDLAISDTEPKRQRAEEATL